MKVLYSPQCDDENTLIYKFVKDKINVTMVYEGKEYSENYDFTGMPNGKLDIYSVETSLPINPLLSAKKENNILYVELLNWIPLNETEHAKLYPEWEEIN